MGEINLSALDINVTEDDEIKAQSPMQQINSALKECGFGWFHVQLLTTSFFSFIAGVLITNTIPYLLPNAECDLDMNLTRKGLLSAMPFIGMICSSAAAGFLIDTFGRKIFLVGGYALIAVCNVVSAFSYTYNFLLMMKFFEGVIFAAVFSARTSFTAEFCHNAIRDRVLMCQASFASVSQIVIAGISWLILIRDWRYTFFDGFLVMNTWNFYLLFMALFPTVACTLYSLLPESPKYLVGQHRYDEARKTLLIVYKKNTGKSEDTFPYANLWNDITMKSTDNQPGNTKSLAQKLAAGLHNMKPLFMKPYARYLILFCTMCCIIMLLYNVIRMWFPQLSTIVEHYSNQENQELCHMLDMYTNDLKLRSANVTTVSKVCVPTKSGTKTYVNSIILGCVCILPYLISGVLVNKVGKKALLIVSGLLSTGATLGLRWSSSRTVVVALFAADMAIAQVMMSLLQATTVEFFPTAIRALAISMLMMMGRIGSLFGNLMFPVLLNMGCVVPFFFLSAVMICVTAMFLVLPNKNN